MSDASDVLARLMAVIEDRKRNPPPRSYTTSLFASGIPKIGEKIREEAEEVIEAAGEADSDVGRAHLIHECADLIYHLFVMMGFKGISLDEVSQELGGRFGISGLDEKASRNKDEDDESAKEEN